MNRRQIERRLGDSRKTAWTSDDTRLAAWVQQGGGTPTADNRKWEQSAGVPWLSLPVMACLGWLTDNFSTADLICYDESAEPDTADQPVWDCPIRDVIEATEDMTPAELYGLYIASHKCWGETYFLKVRTAFGAVSRLIWVPPETPLTMTWNLKPLTSGTRRIAGYAYTVDGRPQEKPVPVEDVIYVRDLVDPLNPARGLSRLRAGLRAMVGHTLADSLAATVFGNQTTAKAFIPDAAYTLDESQIEGVRSHYDQSIAMSGRLPVLTIPGRFEDIGRTPGDMGLDTLPDRQEANICALMGVSALTVGLASGASMRSYDNQDSTNRQSWHNGLIPTQQRLADAFTIHLLPDIDSTPNRYVGWDRSRVDALRDDRDTAVTRAVQMYDGDVAKLNEARAEMGLGPVDDERGDQFKSQSRPEPIPPEPPDEPVAPPEPPDDIEDNHDA